MRWDDDITRSPAWAFVMALVIAVALGVTVGFCGCARPLVRPAPLVRVEYVDEADLIRDALADVWYATVVLDVGVDNGDSSQGSGVLIRTSGATGLVLTADHVITPEDGENRTVIEVTFPDGKKFLGNVRAESHWHDLALIEVLGHASVLPVKLAAAPPRLMDRVWNIGAPCGHPGHVGQARWGRLRPLWGGTRDPLARDITGGFVWEGMSGGPVVNARGELVGIAASIHLADAEGEEDGDNDPQVRVPQMAGAVDWKDVREFLAREGVR